MLQEKLPISVRCEFSFLEFLLGEYHGRPQRDLPSPPQARWEAEGFLPRLPESLEHLNGLITNDKFCISRHSELDLSWWRRPLRLREKKD